MNLKPKRTYFFMAIFALVAVVLDQITKYRTVTTIPLGGNVPVISWLFRLTYVQNRGAAWSAFEGQQWLFALIFVAFFIFLLWEFSTGKMGFLPFERWCLVAVFSGGLGNMIDRIRLGYVVDMIDVTFMNFPVFNVADCFITCGCVGLFVHLLFWNKGFWKEKT